MNYTTNPSKSDWDFIMDNSSSTNILCSWEYAEALEQLKWKSLKILLYSDGIPVSAMLGKYKPIFGFTKSIILGGLGGGCPVIVDGLNDEQYIEILINSIKILQEQSKRNRIFQIKIHAPFFFHEYGTEHVFSEKLSTVLEKNGFNHNTDLYTPIIDISGNEEFLWNNLHKKHRNAVKSAMKKEIKIVKDNSFDDFYQLKLKHQEIKKYQDTSIKDLRILYDVLTKKNMCDLYFSEYDGEYISGAFVWKFGKTIYYVYGASTEKSWELQANNLLHWEIIKDANNNGYEKYNMWGGKIGNNLATQFKMHFSKDAKLVKIPKFQGNIISFRY